MPSHASPYPATQFMGDILTALAVLLGFLHNYMISDIDPLFKRYDARASKGGT